MSIVEKEGLLNDPRVAAFDKEFGIADTSIDYENQFLSANRGVALILDEANTYFRQVCESEDNEEITSLIDPVHLSKSAIWVHTKKGKYLFESSEILRCFKAAGKVFWMRMGLLDDGTHVLIFRADKSFIVISESDPEASISGETVYLDEEVVDPMETRKGSRGGAFRF